MTIKTKVIIYSADDVITSNMEDLYKIAISNDDMSDFDEWLNDEYDYDESDMFDNMEAYLREGRSLADLVEFYKVEYKNYQSDRMESLLDCDVNYHSREIEVSVDVAVS